MSGRLLMKHPQAYPLVYVRGGGTSTQFENKKGWRIGNRKNVLLYSKARHVVFFRIVTSVENMLQPTLSGEVFTLLVQPTWPLSVQLCPAGPAALAPPALILRPAGQGPSLPGHPAGTPRTNRKLVLSNNEEFETFQKHIYFKKYSKT